MQYIFYLTGRHLSAWGKPTPRFYVNVLTAREPFFPFGVTKLIPFSRFSKFPRDKNHRIFSVYKKHGKQNPAFRYTTGAKQRNLAQCEENIKFL
jgi:hypothetical protein